ncbi:MAG: SDR family oxidoreductase [Sphingorhabdus sp.]|uniref:SDR family oxidoreductase n=1 Tax=Sphingorhabdus sp. TaxID=1902408 RepID=UPI00273FC56E|nr:SDR family oxidoreductase [Sphingorhabdus sp.]MDP4758271.1 SDR family oxidoreductase [Sphingorhabdus sp.]MDP4872291.1 SDR family oxidoreductase [Sphingorhabdus sp.]MDP4925965.1 SDR family oxidoreductase [Sphingorhabdus sp.]
MQRHILIFGMGYTATRLADWLRADGWLVTGTRRMSGGDAVAFDDEAAVLTALNNATHILSSVPPMGEGGDPVLQKYGAAIATSAVSWTGYLSSTGVYGDTGGAWVDESAPVGEGRRTARAQADLAWQALRNDVRVFRLPGIYGPGRSALERVTDGKAHRIDMPGQIFSRVHVDDIVDAVCATFDGPAGVYNIADDAPASQNDVIEYACDLLQLEWPPLLSIDAAGLSPMAHGFYAENRRVANGKAKRLLNWQPRYPHYRSGLGACIATIRPSIANALPASASVDQT